MEYPPPRDCSTSISAIRLLGFYLLPPQQTPKPPPPLTPLLNTDGNGVYGLESRSLPTTGNTNFLQFGWQ